MLVGTESINCLQEQVLERLMLRTPNFMLQPTSPWGDHMPLVFLLDDNGEQTARLGQDMLEAGYRVQSWHSLDAFRAAMAEPDTERPAAVVMDMDFLEGEDTFPVLIDECGLDRNAGIPIVVMAVLDDSRARLRTLRAEVCRYLTKPVQAAGLVDLLDELTRRCPSDPYRVLLVDVDRSLLEAHAAILRDAGMDVLTLQEPLLTLDRIESFHPDVLLLDVCMPEANVPVLTSMLRELDEHLFLPVLFLSAETSRHQQLTSLNLSGEDCLVKPVRHESLIDAVKVRAHCARQSRSVVRRMQTTLYEREREHLALNHHAIVSIADAAGNITYVNDKFCQISGYSRDELLGHNHSIVKSGEHPPEFYRDIWRCITRGEVWQGEFCNRRKDGELYWVASTITPFLDENGKPYQYVSLRTDMTQVKRTELTLRAQNAMREVVSEATTGLLAAGAETMDVAIERCLQLAGEHLGADRAYLFQRTDNDTRMSNSHEWCAPGIAPQKDELQDLPVTMFAWWWAQMQHGNMVKIPDVAAMPPESAAERALLESQDIRALCAFPFQQAGKTVGFIGFDQVCTVRDWDAQALALLGLLASQLGSALLRAQSERTLAESANRLNATLESTKDGILAVDDKGGVLFMNRPFREMWNMPESMEDAASREQMLPYALARLVDPQGFMAKVQALYQSQDESDDLIELTDGRMFERHSKPLLGLGQQAGRVWSFHDITERIRSEQEAATAKDRLRKGQLYANIGTWEWNIATGHLFWTERIAPLFGYPLGDLETSYDNFLAAVHPDDRQAVIDAVNACVEHDTPYEIEHRVLWPDGTVRWLVERGAVQRDAERKALNMIGVVQDIDDSKRAELALAERERQLLEAQRLASIGNWTADVVSGKLVWSDEIYRIFGHEPRSFTPSLAAFHAAVHPDDRELVVASEKEAQETGRHDVVHRIVRPDGSIRHVYELAQAETNAHGALVRLTGTVQDVTERVVFEQNLVAAREAADRANQTKSEFLSSMSHELRTPMNAILGFAQLMAHDDSLSVDQQDNLKEILKAGRHLLDLINEVLDLAKVESGHIDLSLESVEIAPVVDECIGLLAPLAALRGIALRHESLAGAAVRADRMRLKQALLNLLSNAVKYNREGGTVDLELKHSGSDRLRIQIVDTGPGIPTSRLAELFDPFTRLGAEGSEIEGTGIGLTITRRIVELMGGTVGVESEIGVGSCFWVELPLETPADAHTATVTPAPMHAEPVWSSASNRHTVLYIEDNPANLKLVSQILAHLPNIHLLTAHTASLGIELAMARRPELILLDINMPGMDGYQVLQVLRADANLKDTPVIAITANAMPRDIERGRAAGFSDYLTKPLDVESFLTVIDYFSPTRRNNPHE